MTGRNRSWWKNTTASREIRLFRLLAQGGKTFTELLKALGWGSQTLTFYLKTLENKGCIASKKHGRNVTYVLLPSNPYVFKMFKLSAPSGHELRVYSRIELDQLDEEALIRDWMTALRFVSLEILRDYVLIGKKGKSEDNELARRILQVHMQDLADTADFYGQVLARRIQAGTIKLDKIKEIYYQMRKNTERQILGLKNFNSCQAAVDIFRSGKVNSRDV